MTGRKKKPSSGSETESRDTSLATDKKSYTNNLRIAYAEFYNSVISYGDEWQLSHAGDERETEFERVVDSLPAIPKARLEDMVGIAFECTNANFPLFNRLGVDGRDRSSSVRPACAVLGEFMVQGFKSAEFGEEVQAIADSHEFRLTHLPIRRHILDLPKASKNPTLPSDSEKYGKEFAMKAMIAYCQFYTAAVTHGVDFCTRRGDASRHSRALFSSLISLLPHPLHVRIDDIVEIGPLVRASGLEYFYRLGVDGKDLGDTIKSATTDLMDLSCRESDAKLRTLISEASMNGRVSKRLAEKAHFGVRMQVSEHLWGK